MGDVSTAERALAPRPNPPVPSRRRQPRVRVRWSVPLRVAGALRDAPPIAARVLDVGPGGARLEVARALDPGQWVTLELPATPHAAGVRGPPAGTVLGRILEREPVVASDGHFSVGVAFARGPFARLRQRLNALVPAVAVAAILATLVPIVLLKEANVSLFWLRPVANTYGLLVSAFIVSRLFLSLFYRPPRDTGHRPPVTAIVACKNEGPSIGRTLECLFRSEYPPEKLEVIAVDDGSTDDTLEEMLRAARAHPGLQVVSFAQNLGKRHAMAEGARRARGEVLVYVDSDSFLRPDAITKLASAFSDPTVAGVCGHADVQNARVNVLTKMQEVRYYVAFRVVKAAESIFSAVTCCSGCLAAYRRSAVMEVLDHWLDQRFLGVPATFGDDRSLTRYMLRRYRVVYHSEAVCTTIVPERWGVFFRQQLRWKKSWARENLLLGAFMWKRHPLMAFSFYTSVLFPLVSPGIALHAVGLPLLGFGSFSFLYVYGVVLMSALYSLVYLARHRTWLWVYGIWFTLFYLVALTWQTYYAVLTVRRNHWGTR